ncbi:MAG: aspartate carbamoyltransferase regulatory subunit [Clostridia bacterium]|nr:aspartate carbamoyltransferase regulatory subunit [Clostridia bacterium]
MNIDSIINGIVIDHITAGKGMKIYQLLSLDQMDCPVALIRNAYSKKMGRKDIIKIDADITLNMDILGYVDPCATLSIIKEGKVASKQKPMLPRRLTGVISCKNPRCITTTEQELPHVFTLTDAETRTYRCLYCEAKAE